MAVETPTLSSIEPRVSGSDMSLISDHECIISSVFNFVRNDRAIERFRDRREHLFLQESHILLLIQKFSSSLCDHRRNGQHHIVGSVWGKSI